MAWWNRRWDYRRRIRIKNSAQSSALTNFPVAVVLDPSRFDYKNAESAGQDIRFVDSDNAVLSHEIEVWNTTGKSVVWVKIPTIDALTGFDHFWMYYGNMGGGSNEWKSNVWGNGYTAVYHMNQDPSGTVPQVLDSIGGFHLTSSGSMTAGDLVDGLIGKGIDFDGTNDDLLNATLLDNNVSTGLCIELLLYSRQALFTHQNLGFRFGSPNRAILLEIIGGTRLLRFTYGSSDSDVNPAVMPDLPVNRWFYIACVVNASIPELYVDGILKSTGTINTTANPGDEEGVNFRIFTPSGQYPMNGIIDELRVSLVGRPTSWIAATYLSMIDNLLDYGAEERKWMQRA